jgi:Chloramphenicol phosphotransferase-like protein
VERVHLGFEYSIPALSKGGNRLIVDYPFHYADSLPRCLDLVSGYTVLYVGVFCPIEALEQREAARGDRKIGFARYQSERVHVNSEYDVEVDTQELAPNHAALKVIAALDTIATPTARTVKVETPGDMRSFDRRFRPRFAASECPQKPLAEREVESYIHSSRNSPP